MAGRTAAAPNPQIFSPDALEQIYATKTFGGDPTQSGLAYAFMKNREGIRGDNQQSYLQDLRIANAINAMLEQGDQQNDMNKTILNAGINAGDKLGIPLDATKAYELLIGNPARAGHDVTNLSTDKLRASIAKMQAEAANAGRGGGSGPSVDTTIEITPLGVQGKMTGKKGATVSEDLIEKNRQIFNRLSDKQRSEVPEHIQRQYRQSYTGREER